MRFPPVLIRTAAGPGLQSHGPGVRDRWPKKKKLFRSANLVLGYRVVSAACGLLRRRDRGSDAANARSAALSCLWVQPRAGRLTTTVRAVEKGKGSKHCNATRELRRDAVQLVRRCRRQPPLPMPFGALLQQRVSKEALLATQRALYGLAAQKVAEG